MTASTPLPSQLAGNGKRGSLRTIIMVVGLFFAWGFITVLNDPLIAKLKGLFSLNYTEAMLTQFAFFLGYFIFSIPAGQVLSRLGYIRTQEWKYTSADFYMANLMPFSGRGYPQLYDMRDKTESYSVASPHPDVAKAMNKRLRQLQAEFAPLRTAPAAPERPMPQKHVPEVWDGFGAD